MKKVLFLVMIMVVALLVSGISDTKACITDTVIADNEVASCANETGNHDSASATITIRMWIPLKVGGLAC